MLFAAVFCRINFLDTALTLCYNSVRLKKSIKNQAFERDVKGQPFMRGFKGIDTELCTMKQHCLKSYEINGKSIYGNVFKPIALLVCFVCVFVFCIVYKICSENVENVYSTYTQNEIDGFMKAFDSFYIESKNIGISINMDPDIKKVSEGILISNEDKLAAGKRLKQYKNFNIYTESIYFYNSRDNLLYSSEAIYPWDINNSGGDLEIYSFIREHKAFVSYQKAGKQRVYSVIVYPQNSKNDAVVINYYGNVFLNLLRKEHGITVIDSENKCFISSELEPNTDMTNEGFFKDVLSSGNESGILKTKSDGERVIVAYSKTPEFIFTAAEFTSELTGTIAKKLIPWIIALGIFFFAVLYLSVNYGRRMYEFLYGTYKSIENLKYHIQKNENKNRNQRVNDYLRTLLFMGDRQMSEIIRDVDFNVEKDEPINTVLFKIDNFRNIIEDNPKYRESIPYSVRNVIEELSEQITGVDLNIINGYDVLMLYNTRSCGNERINEIIQRLQKLFREKLDISVSAFIGAGADDITGFSELYKTVTKLKEYSFYEGSCCILTADYLKKYPDNNFFDTFELRAQLISAMKSGAYDKMLTIFESVLKQLKKAPPKYLKVDLVQFAFQIQQTVSEISEYNIKLFEVFPSFTNNIVDAESIGVVEDMFAEIFDFLYKNILSLKDLKGDNFVNRVKQLTEENYHDPSFCRNIVSERLNINANYADTLFKKKTSKTIANFITDYRLEKSCELLKTTDYKVNKIAELVGYTGSSHFIYSFKKKYGVTPNDYRKK